uniref:TORTIFOLIA1/SINE1-2 N-terminal domain-containing protein n=1 Tax=Brassica oleracea var. oleracea TaxID=109376 RepID=A0A0D3AFQ3_BRAOL
MGRNLGSAFREELANLDKDPDTNKTAMSNLRTIVKDLDAKALHVFLAQLSETKEIGSDSGGGYTVSLFEDLARSHGVKIAPHVETIMPGIVRTLSSCGGALSVQQACSKAVAAIARYGIDPATAEDKKKNLIHSLCKPLSDSLLDSQHLDLGASLCLKSLVDCDSWRFASSEMVNTLCQSLAVSLEAASESHMALVIALAKRNAFTVEALFVKSGLRILDLGVVEGDAQKRVLAVQMLNFLMKYLNPKSMSSEVELVLQEMEKHVEDEVYFVRVAVHETLGTKE